MNTLASPLLAAADRETVPPSPDRKGGQGRAQQRRGADQADFEDAQPEREEIRRQHDRNEAVGEAAQRPADEDAADHPVLHQAYNASYITMPWRSTS